MIPRFWNDILYKLGAFPVRMYILGEAQPHSRWGVSPFPVSHIPILDEDVHSRWGTSPFPVRMCILREDESQWNKHPNRECTYREWGCASSGMGWDVPHREWGCDSLGMCILTGNTHSLYRVIHLMRIASFTRLTKGSRERKHVFCLKLENMII